MDLATAFTILPRVLFAKLCPSHRISEYRIAHSLLKMHKATYSHCVLPLILMNSHPNLVTVLKPFFRNILSNSSKH